MKMRALLLFLPLVISQTEFEKIDMSAAFSLPDCT